ncbi:MAG: hypothetical protein ACJARG_001347 [Arcticibacterium sp.]|jgi:hypothetical protein
MNKSGLLLLIGLLIPFWGASQILDDSTKQVYGPNTIGYLLEGNVLQDDTILIHPDTLIDNFRFSTKNKTNGWIWQDLGNEGTASKTFFLQTPDNAFTETGLTSFSQFWAPKVSQVKYYDTRSPYTNMAYVQNTNGMANLGFTHAQNIKENWNIGLNVNRLSSSKQYSASNNEDRLIGHWDYTLSTNFITKNSRYTFLGALIHLNHSQIEQGGIRSLNNAEFIKKSDLKSGYNTQYQQSLNGIESSERWNNIHVYHQYKLTGEIQIFHTFDYQRQKYFHSDTLISSNSPFGIYTDSLANDLEKVKTNYFYQNFQNRVGLKGYFKGFKYAVGLTNRVYSFNAVHKEETGNNRTEVILGGNAGYWFPDSSSYLNTDFYFGFGKGTNVFLNSKLRVKGFNLGFKFIRKPAALFSQSFQSDVASWNNNFQNITYTEASANYLLRGKKLWFEPKVRINLVSNYIYFNENLKPTALESDLFTTKIGLNVGLELKNFKASNRLILASTNNSSAYRLPSIVNNTNLEFHLFYAKVLHLYLGTDVYYRSKFKADAYSPILRGFHIQNSQEIWGGAPVVDIYTKFMIKRVKLAFTYNFINQGLPNQGFYTTPNYLGMARTFFLKVNWPLFD